MISAPNIAPALARHRNRGSRAGALAAAALLPLIWIVLFPPSPDLAAQVYRVHLFSVDGFALWDNNWYAGHYLLDYSLLFPPLAATLGLRAVGVAAVTVSGMIFWRLAKHHLPGRAAPATALFTVGATGDLFIGRITFALGVTFGLAAVLCAGGPRRWSTVACSLGCAAASPVASTFLVLVGAADLLTHRRPSRAAALALPALSLTVGLMLLFPEGGLESFDLLSLLAAAGLSLLLLLLLPAQERLLRRGVGLYVLALVVSYVVPSPMGSNVVRLGVLFEPAILIGAVGVEDGRRAVGRVASRLGRERGHRLGSPLRLAGGRLLLSAVAAGLVLWQINGPVVQSVQASGDPSSRAAYYLPVQRFLATAGGPMRIEVPFTGSHWDTVFLGSRFALARGWERQLDSKYDSVFYAPVLSASAYRDWLASTAVRFVALPDAPPDQSSRQEGQLIRRGLPFLRQIFVSPHWRVYEVIGAEPLASGPGRLTKLGRDGFTLHALRAGTFLVRVRYTQYWTVTQGAAVVSASADDWTQVAVRRPGAITLDARF